MKFSENTRNVITLTIIVGLSFVLVLIIRQTDFAKQIELITSTSYARKIFLLTIFTTSLLGNYTSIYKLWKSPDSKSNIIFALIYSTLLIITSVLLLLWISDMEMLLDLSFEKLKFPNDVDEVLYRLRVSFLRSIYWIFLFLGSIGLISFFGILFIQKGLFNKVF